MKKILSIILVATFMLTFAATAALAADDKAEHPFSFRAGSANGSTSDFGYSGNYYEKLSDLNYIEVRHNVSESAAGYTNLIAAERDDHKYVGSKWMTSNNGSFYKTNGGCMKSYNYGLPVVVATRNTRKTLVLLLLRLPVSSVYVKVSI